MRENNKTKYDSTYALLLIMHIGEFRWTNLLRAFPRRSPAHALATSFRTGVLTDVFVLYIYIFVFSIEVYT